MNRQFIINFHGIGQPARPLEAGEERYWISVDAFERILDYIVDQDGETRANISITFDDGNISDFLIALPRLLNRKLTARFFIVAGRLELPNFLSSSEATELRRAGMTVGAHGFAHLDWRRASDDELEREIRGARDMIAEAVHEPIDEVAIPYGSYDRRVLRWLKRAGYKAIYTSDGGACLPHFRLKPRNCLRRDMDPSDIERILRSANLITDTLQGARLLLKQRRRPPFAALRTSTSTPRKSLVPEGDQIAGRRG